MQVLSGEDNIPFLTKTEGSTRYKNIKKQKAQWLWLHSEGLQIQLWKVSQPSVIWALEGESSGVGRSFWQLLDNLCPQGGEFSQN